jgi:outer membrane immunogenic protein
MKMLRGFVAGLALVGAAAVSSAPASAQTRWSGWYLGGHLGGASTDIDWTFVQTGLADQPYSHSASGLAGGLQVGVQHQWNNVVAGIEVSFTGTDLQDRFASTLVADRTREAQTDWVGMFTARLGYAFSPSFLGYIKGGYAAAPVAIRTSVTSTGAVSGYSREIENGWTIGTGLEWKFMRDVSLGLEYNFVSLETSNRTNASYTGFVTGSHVVRDAELHLVTARLNFHFNRPAPVAEPMK